MILKPFMLRRIKRDVENELTEKVEVLLYCPLTIRQKLLYVGLKKKIKVEELLQGQRLTSRSSQQTSAVTSSLMNLVMQFRKVSHSPGCSSKALSFPAVPVATPSLMSFSSSLEG